MGPNSADSDGREFGARKYNSYKSAYQDALHVTNTSIQACTLSARAAGLYGVIFIHSFQQLLIRYSSVETVLFV